MLVPADERAGNLTVVTVDNDTAERIRSQMKAIIRPMWSNPPNHGARIIATILNNPALSQEWQVLTDFLRLWDCSLIFLGIYVLGWPITSTCTVLHLFSNPAKPALK